MVTETFPNRTGGNSESETATCQVDAGTSKRNRKRKGACMKKNITGTIVALSATITLALAGCGSSGGSGSSTGTASAVSGVAAAGSPLVGTAYLKDSSTPAKELTVPL